MTRLPVSVGTRSRATGTFGRSRVNCASSVMRAVVQPVASARFTMLPTAQPQ